jgi:hypothetical protein
VLSPKIALVVVLVLVLEPSLYFPKKAEAEDEHEPFSSILAPLTFA